MAAMQLEAVFGLEKSVCIAILKENGNVLDRAVDHILTMNYLNEKNPSFNVGKSQPVRLSPLFLLLFGPSLCRFGLAAAFVLS